MIIDFTEKGISREEFTEKNENIRASGRRKAAIFVSIIIVCALAFFVGFCLIQNSFVCGIAAAALLLLVMPGRPDNANPVRLSHERRKPPIRPRDFLHLNFGWYYGRIAALAAGLYLVYAFSRFDFDSDSAATDLLWITVRTVLIICIAALLYMLSEGMLKKSVVRKRSQRCTQEVTAHCLGDAYVGFVTIPTGLSVMEKRLQYGHLFRGRKKYEYSFNGVTYYIFDQGERNADEDMLIRIDPSAPEIYYEEDWEL